MTPQESPIEAGPVAETPSPAGDKKSGLQGWTWTWLWTTVVFMNLSNAVQIYISTDLAVLAFSDWQDPCAPPNAESPTCQRVVGKVNQIAIVFTMIAAVLAVFSNPIVGALADLYGRKPVALVAGGCSLLAKLALVAVGIFHQSIYYALVVGEFSSLCPITVPFMLWITDMTVPQERAGFFGRYSALLAVEGIAVPVVSVMSSNSARIIMINLLTFVGIMIVAFCMPESLDHSARRAEALPSAVLQQVTQEGGQVLTHLKNARRLLKNPAFSKIIVVIFIGSFVQFGAAAITFLYLKQRFGIDMQSLAPVSMVQSCSLFIVNVFCIEPLQRLFGCRKLVFFSFAIGAICSVGPVLSPSLEYLYLFAVMSGIPAVASPVVFALGTHLCEQSSEETGPAIGALQAVTQVAAAIGPVFFRLVFLADGALHGGVWYFAVLIQVFGLGIVWAMEDISLDETKPLMAH